LLFIFDLWRIPEKSARFGFPKPKLGIPVDIVEQSMVINIQYSMVFSIALNVLVLLILIQIKYSSNFFEVELCKFL